MTMPHSQTLASTVARLVMPGHASKSQSCVSQCQLSAQQAQLHLVDFIKEVEGRGEAGLQGKAQREGGHCLLSAAEKAEGAVVPGVRPAASALPSEVEGGAAMHNILTSARCRTCCWLLLKQKRRHDLLLPCSARAFEREGRHPGPTWRATSAENHLNPGSLFTDSTVALSSRLAPCRPRHPAAAHDRCPSPT